LRGVFKTKRDEYGAVTQVKARLVARGNLQSHGMNFKETFASVAKPMLIRLLEAIKTLEDLKCDQMDFAAAYLNAAPDVAISMKPPPGYCSEDQVLILWKA
jgi:hypothetical protein